MKDDISLPPSDFTPPSRLAQFVDAFVSSVMQSRRQLIAIFSGVLVACLLLVYFFYDKETRLLHDFQLAAFLGKRLESPQALFNESDKTAQKERLEQTLSELAVVVEREPTLQFRYDPVIAQSAINLGDLSLAEPFAERAIESLQAANLPLFASFATTTMLIEKGQLADAIEAAHKLDTQILAYYAEEASAVPFEFDVLYASNLFRLSALNHTLGKMDRCNEFAGRLKSFLRLQGDNSGTMPVASLATCEAFLGLLKDKQLSILAYWNTNKS